MLCAVIKFVLWKNSKTYFIFYNTKTGFLFLKLLLCGQKN